MSLNMSAITELNKVLNDFLEPFDCSAYFNDDFCYWYVGSKINYTLVVTDNQADSFLAFAESLFPSIHADIFLWSFLHELGHHETLDDFDEETHLLYRTIVNNENLSDEEYYNLPLEKAATEWAGNYMLSHISEISKLWNKIAPLIQQFYKEN